MNRASRTQSHTHVWPAELLWYSFLVSRILLAMPIVWPVGAKYITLFIRSLSVAPLWNTMNSNTLIKQSNVWLMGHSQGNQSALHTTSRLLLNTFKRYSKFVCLKCECMKHLLFMANFHMERIKMSNYKIISDEHEHGANIIVNCNWVLSINAFWCNNRPCSAPTESPRSRIIFA